MAAVSNFLESAFSDGILDYDLDNPETEETPPKPPGRTDSISGSVKKDLVLFLGAAISTFKPAQLP